jgi:hypothetical protein
MKIKIWLASLLLSTIPTGFLITQSQPAYAACGFVDGVWSHELAMTPACVAENNAIADAVKAAAEAKAIQDQKDVEARAKENAERDYIANGSRPCTLYPASITPECVAENLIDAAKKTAAMEEKAIEDQKKADAAAKANAELDYIANGSRPCTLYPASITAACAAENLEYETKRQIAAAAKFEADQIEAEQKALKQAKDDYIRNGSRPCSVFPASTTPECAAANLKYEEIKKVEIAALTAAREISTKALITTKDENGSLLVASNIPKGVDLLNTKVRLVNSKGKLVDAGEIRYDSAGKPYFVFDKQIAKGNYKIELSISKKKSATIAIKL